MLVLCMVVISCVGGACALTIPGQRGSLNYVPVYQDGKIVAYVAEFPVSVTPVQVSPTRINYVDASGKVRYYKETIVQSSVPPVVLSPDPETGFTSPFPATWDQSMMKFTSVEYTTYCLEHGIPKRGTFAINLPSGAWMR